MSIYLSDLSAVALAICGTFSALRLLSLRRIKRQLGTEKPVALHAYCRWSMVRLIIWLIALGGCAVLYYGTLSGNTSQYCLLICAIAGLFCRPSQDDFERLHEQGRKEAER